MKKLVRRNHRSIEGSWVQRHAGFLIVLAVFLAIKAYLLIVQKGISWDGAVYVGMGKFIFSMGQIGLWEASRPLVWPFLLGGLWKVGLSPIVWGRLLAVLLSVGILVLVYGIGQRFFSKKVCVLACTFLAFSPVFLFYSSTLLTGIPSTFFSLLAVYYFLENRQFSAGFFVGVAFLTRYLQLLVGIPMMILLFFLCKKNWKVEMGKFVGGLSFVVLPFMMLNSFLYGEVIYPLQLQVFMTTYTGWIYHEPFAFYVLDLFFQLPLWIFVIVGLWRFRKSISEGWILGMVFLLFFLFFSFTPHKESRFIIVFLPYLALLSAYGFFECLQHVGKVSLRRPLCLLLLLLWAVVVLPHVDIPSFQVDADFSEYVDRGEVVDGLWISNPQTIAYSDKRAALLMYYPLFSSEKIEEIIGSLGEAKHVLLNTCDVLPCRDRDIDCPEGSDRLLKRLASEFSLVGGGMEGICRSFIYRK